MCNFEWRLAGGSVLSFFSKVALYNDFLTRLRASSAQRSSEP